MKYSENTRPQNRWWMTFWYEYLQLGYLRLNGYDDVNYQKNVARNELFDALWNLKYVN